MLLCVPLRDAKIDRDSLSEHPVSLLDGEPSSLQVVQRSSGETEGHYDRYYYTPCGKKLRSMIEVLRFLENKPSLDKPKKISQAATQTKQQKLQAADTPTKKKKKQTPAPPLPSQEARPSQEEETAPSTPQHAAIPASKAPRHKAPAQRAETAKALKPEHSSVPRQPETRQAQHQRRVPQEPTGTNESPEQGNSPLTPQQNPQPVDSIPVHEAAQQLAGVLHKPGRKAADTVAPLPTAAMHAQTSPVPLELTTPPYCAVPDPQTTMKSAVPSLCTPQAPVRTALALRAAVAFAPHSPPDVAAVDRPLAEHTRPRKQNGKCADQQLATYRAYDSNDCAMALHSIAEDLQTRGVTSNLVYRTEPSAPIERWEQRKHAKQVAAEQCAHLKFPLKLKYGVVIHRCSLPKLPVCCMYHLSRFMAALFAVDFAVFSVHVGASK